jgi:KUP system potassium uptake protein
LKKGIYGLSLSGKWWNEEFTNWLFSDNFDQSKADPTFYVKHYPDGRYIKLIYHTDDMIYYGTDDEIERKFENDIKGKFQISFNGPAQWFLQMRIYAYSCGSISLDQHRYALNIVKRYNPPEAPWGVPRFRETPAPLDYVFTKGNRPTPEQKKEIETRFKGLHFRSAVCSILYLAFGTRPDIMFITCKLSKACHDPGIKDYEALLWLFGYIRNYPDYAIKFYHDVTQSPVYQIAQSQNIPQAEIIGFSDASWQDCPDTGRSTAGEIIYCQGGIVHARSHVPVPVAMSSAEAEYVAACSACMAASHLRMLLYDYKHLGTKHYNQVNQILDIAPSILMVDNQAAVQMGMNDRLTKLTRHISRRFHYVREGIKQGLHKLYWISKDHQLSDILTKTQSSTIINPLLQRAMFRLPTFLTKPNYSQIVTGQGNSRGVSNIASRPAYVWT